MLIAFQMLFTAFAMSAIIAVLKRRHEQVLGPKGAVFWLVFWIASIVIVFYPNGATRVANAFGIGRGSDLIIYLALALMFYILFRLHIKIESTARDITKLVRHQAIERKEQ